MEFNPHPMCLFELVFEQIWAHIPWQQVLLSYKKVLEG